jgi:hypothetical protein
MPFEISQWSAGEIAALAAAVAALASFVVAAVNTWSARRLAMETARREFRLAGAREYLEFVDRLIAVHRAFLDAGPGMVASLTKAADLLTAGDHEKGTQEMQALLLRLSNMASNLAALRDTHKSTGLFAFFLSDRRVRDKYHEWLTSHGEVVRAFVAAGGPTVAPEHLRKLEESASVAFTAAVRLRMAIEEFIFGNRGWLRRGCYYLWSSARTTLRTMRSVPPNGKSAP